MRILKQVIIGLALVLSSGFAFADEGPTNINDDGHAIEGYDTVAYFTLGGPVKGDPQFSYKWNHATWLFSSEDNLNTFKENPEKYAPQFGGYCAWAVSRGGFAPIEPEQWTIVDDKLYLNFNAKINKKWNKKQAFHIERANKNWFDELLEEAKENVSG